MLTVPEVEREVDAFRDRLAGLYSNIECWVKEQKPLSTFARSRVEVVEEVTGAYEADRLEVAIPGIPSIRFVPRGIFMLGAHARVDVMSSLGREILVWVEAAGSVRAVDTVSGRAGELSRVTSPLYQGVAEGWAWSDAGRNRLVHLDAQVLWREVIGALSP